MKEEVKKGGQAMKDLIERAVLMGVGAVSVTKDTVESLVDEFVKRGELTREEGEKLVAEAAERGRLETASLKEKASVTYQDTLQTLGIAPRETVVELDRRLAVLEAKVYGKPSHVEESVTGFSSTTTEDEEPS